MFSRSQRLPRSAVEDVLKRGTRKNTQHFSLRVLSRNDTKTPRLSVGVGKKVSKKASVRNKIKRQLRHALKDVYPTIPSGSDMLISVLKDVSDVSYEDLKQELAQLLTQ